MKNSNKIDNQAIIQDSDSDQIKSQNFKDFLQQRKQLIEQETKNIKSRQQLLLVSKSYEKNHNLINYTNLDFHGIDRQKINIFNLKSKARPINIQTTLKNSSKKQQSNRQLISESPKLGIQYQQNVQNTKIDYKLFNKQLQNYLIGPILGNGSFSCVKLGLDQNTNQKVAIKIYDKFKLQNKKLVQNEIKIMNQLDHPNIIKLIEKIENLLQINLVMEYIGTRSLNRFQQSISNKRISENEARYIFLQIAQGTNYLHSQNFAHRDFKLENIILNENRQVKIIDLGFAIKFKDNQSIQDFCGTANYMSPEIINKIPYYPQKSDIWALGVILFSMVSGYLPFRAQTDRELKQIITAGEYMLPDDISNELQDLISKIIVINSLERFNIEQILQHTWLN